MSGIVIQFSPEDHALKDAIRREFGDAADFVDVRSFDGASEVIQAILPMVPILTAFLVKHLGQRLETTKAKRVLVTPDGELEIVGYTAADVEGIIDKVKEEP